MRKEYKRPENLVELDLSNSFVIETGYDYARTFPKHAHDRPFFSLLLNGRYAESVGKRSYLHLPMTVWWRKPNIERGGEIRDKGTHLLNIEIKDGYLDLLRSEHSIPDDFAARNTRLTELMLRFYAECRAWNSGSALVVDGLTLEMLGTALNQKTSGEDRQPKWLLRIVERLNAEFLEFPSVVQLAIDENVHPVYLARV
ncbi:MAG: hypothetical protein KDB79_06970, partial [Acidobacteria bacterium]|nr:hypothetical protein [Acidobacteriota bacterium]